MLAQLYEILWTGFLFGFTCAFAAIIISPLQFLKIIRQETGKNYFAIFRESYFNYGIAIFFKGSLPYAWTNFFSSMSFGLSEYAYNIVFPDEYIFTTNMVFFVFLAFLRAFMGGLTESIFSSYYELKEIARNKGHIMQAKPKFITVFTPILIRNVIFWHATVVSYLIQVKYSMSYMNFTLLSFFLGIVFGLISVPFDVIATQNCGAKDSMGTFQRFMQILKETNMKNKLFFAGTLMRVIQMGILTIVTVFTMLFLNK